MKLKDVSVESLKEVKKLEDVVCITEMMSLFDCFEKNDFDSRPCLQLSKALEDCYSNFSVAREERRLQLVKQRASS